MGFVAMEVFHLAIVSLIAAAINLIGWPASVVGNELAIRFGRRRIVILIMTISALYSCLFGFTASWPFVVIVAMSLIYGLTVTGDSASITAGVVAAEEEVDSRLANLNGQIVDLENFESGRW